jgi:heat shock protein HslJ
MRPRLASRLAGTLALALAGAACSVPRRIESAPPTPDELRRVDYGRGGLASRPSLVDDFHIVGDLDGDGVDETVVLLAHSGGASAVWSSFAVVKRIGGRLVHVASATLGDRVQVRAARIEGGRLVASGVRPGPADAACCAGELVEWAWALGDGRLDAVESRATGRLSLDTLAGSTWVLRAWDVGEPAPANPAVTLSVTSGRITGSSGCNRYTAVATDGAMPGDLSVGPVAGTRMACPAAESAVESRFLQRLDAARRYGFRAGRLAITSTAADGSTSTMLFEAKGP